MREILVLNAGSSSLKFAVFETAQRAPSPKLLVSGQFAGFNGYPTFELKAADGTRLSIDSGGALPKRCEDAATAVFDVLEKLECSASGPIVVGHRLVHGGPAFSEPILVGDETLVALDAIIPLAPLHMPAGLAVLKATRARYPKVPQIVCFDTAFHATQPEIATRVALPKPYADNGYRRYGFHGLNYEHLVGELPRLSGAPLPSRLLACHLGNGASLCAIRDGNSIATTMSFTPLDGLVMGTRCGSIDPGLLIALIRNEGLDADALEALLYRQSGLSALSGGCSEMRELLVRSDDDACHAVDAFCYWAARHAGSMIMAMGGLDAIVFTGGIGENSPEIRARIAARLGWLGVVLDPDRNAANRLELSPDRTTVTVWRIAADEEATIARSASQIIESNRTTRTN